MKIHNTYSYGQLFCFSGLDGETSRKNDFVGMLTDRPVAIRFHFENAVTLKFNFDHTVQFKAVTGDMLDGDGCLILFCDSNTVCGRTTVLPEVFTEKVSKRVKKGGTEKIVANGSDFYLKTKKKGKYFYFSFSYKKTAHIPPYEYLVRLKKQRYTYFENIDILKDKKYQKLFTKCISINKENVYSPEGIIPCRWTTPDRVPHRFMWLWDSAFHAMAFSLYNAEMAKESIISVLSTQREDGFIAHMASPDGQISNLTQPQVLCWASWEVYKRCGDKEFLKTVAPALKKFLLWTVNNRDKNDNGLLEWFTEPDYIGCRCGESGLDNSPRFDFDQDLDAIDFSTYLCHDAEYLAKIYQLLGDGENQKLFEDIHERTKIAINEKMWCEEDGLYYDLGFDGNLTKMASSASFLPLFAGICDQRRADMMVKVLLDKKRFWTEFPVPSIPKDSEFYDTDMWRGCSWLNIDYFIIKGLKKYGYGQIAKNLTERLLKCVLKWYNSTGNVFEFYDADNKISPFMLKRKGEPVLPPDYRKHVHAITDYNWSACFIILLLAETED